MEKKEYTRCFGCGKDNPIGLKLDMYVNESDSYADFVPKPEHQSYDDRMHGWYPRSSMKLWEITFSF